MRWDLPLVRSWKKVQTALALKAILFFFTRTVVTSVPHHLSR